MEKNNTPTDDLGAIEQIIETAEQIKAQKKQIRSKKNNLKEKRCPFVERYKIITRIIVLGVFIVWTFFALKVLYLEEIGDKVRIFEEISSVLVWVFFLYLLRRGLENPEVVNSILNKVPFIGKK